MNDAERIKVLEDTIAELTLRLQQQAARLRVVDLMEEQAANRLGFQIPLRPAPEAHSLRVVH